MNKGWNSLREFINNNQLHIPKRYANTTYEELLTKEFIFKTTRTALNFAYDIKSLHKNLDFIWINGNDSKHIIKFKEKEVSND